MVQYWLFFLLVAFDFHVGSTVAWAVDYPSLSPANTQVIVIFEPRVDFAVRIGLGERATGPIDTVVFAQGADKEVGLPTLNTFRRAHGRGIPGRHIFSTIGSLPFDFWKKRNDWLADSQLKSPARVVNFGGLNPLKRLSLFDYPHEKIEIYNAGTPDEVVVLSGRNREYQDITNFDMTVILRRIEPDLPYIGDEIRSAYEYLWETVRRVEPEVAVKKRKIPANTPASDPLAYLRTAEQRAQFERIEAILKSPVDPSAPMEPFEARPKSMRVVTNDLLANSLTGVFGTSYRARKKIPNDIFDSYVAKIETAKKIDLMFMNVIFPQKVLEALLTALRNGAEVNLYTNGPMAHRGRGPLGAAYDLALEQLVPLLNHGGSGVFHAYLLNTEKLAQDPAFKDYGLYTHRKTMVIDDHVSKGSDNCNIPGQCRGSEIVMWTENDARFAQIVRNQIHSELHVFDDLSCERALTELKGYSLLKRGVNYIAYSLY